MSNRNWVENTIFAIIILNFFVLANVFLMPRAQFMMDHWTWSQEALMESSGASDTPNQYPKTYRIVNSIRKITENDSMIFMPPDNSKNALSHSAALQRLYPRKVYFMENLETQSLLSHVSKDSNTYIIFNENWGKELCLKESMEYLEKNEIGICRAGK